MKKVSKAILIALGVLLAIIAVAVLGVNLYIQSAGTQARIQRGLSRALHAPVKIASLSFMPWYGLKLAGVTMQDANAAESSDNDNALQISAISARIQLWRLLRREVVIKELTVDKAKVAWHQTPGGKWQLPLQRTSEDNVAPAESGTVAPETPPQAGPMPQPQPAPPVETTPQQITPEPPPVKINHFRLVDASFDFSDKNHKEIVSVSGIYVQSSHPTVESVNGSAFISQIAIQNLFFMRDCQSEFHYSPDQFSLFNARSAIAGGASIGSLGVRIAQPDSPFNLDVKFSDIQIERLLAEAGIADNPASGSLAGFLHLQGNLRSSAAATGNGQFVITGGYISHVELFTQLGEFLHAKKLEQFGLQEVLANYHIADGKVSVDQIALKSSDFSLTGQGAIDMASGFLLLKCRLSIGANITRSIPDFLMENFGRDEVTNSRYVDFNVYNTITSPRTDLLKLIGNNLEHSAKSIWKSFFGKPKAQPMPVPAPTPDAAPVPAAAASPTP